MSYDPTIGRFISEDPIAFEGGDANLYRYVGNSSTDFTDPSGLQATSGGLVGPPVPAPPVPFPPTLHPPIKPGVPPNAQQLLNNPKVQTAICVAWSNSQNNPPGGVHEEGGWIYMNPLTGDIQYRPTPSGTPVINPQPGDKVNTDHSHPPTIPGYVVVGIYHTHPKNPFPSEDDLNSCVITKVPGIIIHKTGYQSYGPPTRIGGLGGLPGFP